ncbi:hypothetical protein [Burkholderia sp. LMG 21824]|uniref:hypothetical protein n=1 Tax=Burkholderia sp. LMG 21824 TaxID=3158172 RepID=UPI003C308E42
MENDSTKDAHDEDEEADRRLLEGAENWNIEYMNLSEDWSKMVNGDGSKERSIAGLKLLGKGAFNIGKWTLTEGLPKFAEAYKKSIEDQIAKSKK